MDTTQGLAAILRDARKGALLRMRSEIYSHPRRRGIRYAAAFRFHHQRLWNTGSPAFWGDPAASAAGGYAMKVPSITWPRCFQRPPQRADVGRGVNNCQRRAFRDESGLAGRVGLVE